MTDYFRKKINMASIEMLQGSTGHLYFRLLTSILKLCQRSKQWSGGLFDMVTERGGGVILQSNVVLKHHSWTGFMLQHIRTGRRDERKKIKSSS